ISFAGYGAVAGWLLEDAPCPDGVLLGGSSPNDVWHVGRDGAVVRFDGRSWAPARGGGALPRATAAWGSAANDIWALTSQGFYHWDGASWTRFDVNGMTYPDVIWGASRDDVWAGTGSIGKFLEGMLT